MKIKFSCNGTVVHIILSTQRAPSRFVSTYTVPEWRESLIERKAGYI
jgi:hypothetical protein